MTITLAAVYTPIALQGGLTGALFREFAFTLAGAVFISGVVALTSFADDVSAIFCARSMPIVDLAEWSIGPSIDSANGMAAISIATLQARPAVYIVWGRHLTTRAVHVRAIPKWRRKNWRRKKIRA